MTKDVKIFIKTKIDYENTTKEFIEYQYKGKLYLKNNNKFLRYKEDCKQELGNTWTTIKWSEVEKPYKVLLVRQGETKMKNVFQEGFKHISNYRSLHGSYKMEIITNKININKKVEAGNIKLYYKLQLNNLPIGDYILEIDYIYD